MDENEDFGVLADRGPDEDYELSGVIAFYENPKTGDGAFNTFLTGDIPLDVSQLDGMQAFIMNVQAMMEEYLDSDIH